ncbi:unnamed protein product [Acanthoscelides obtectus]|uniref:Uncharacterized protein n=1 Tax=Acanthoscelides obtectus TaxID=200917 RepID=A0A9P0K173_ACAOB|nr:unnamed protein product [Acanthoscelides obtectus]CAK1627514.1 hypothetical protein AOBTE_LOCUS4639 [Acanthoscelides obtectus]
MTLPLRKRDKNIIVGNETYQTKWLGQMTSEVQKSCDNEFGFSPDNKSGDYPFCGDRRRTCRLLEVLTKLTFTQQPPY